MKLRHLVLLIFAILCADLTHSQGMWEWEHGDSAVFGTVSVTPQGVPHPDNQPQGGYATAHWTTDSACYFMGGYYGNPALWKYDVYLGQWIWVDGQLGALNNTILVGDQGEFHQNNWPKARQLGAATWTDNEGNLWLMGSSSQKENLLWKYNLDSSAWAWMLGDTIYPGNYNPVYGSKGVAAPTNNPGDWNGESMAHWTAPDGDLWLFQDQDGVMWRYDITSNMWVWEAGTPGQFGYYGTGGFGVYDTSHTPGYAAGNGFWQFPCWVSDNKLWMFAETHNASIWLWSFDLEIKGWAANQYWSVPASATEDVTGKQCVFDTGMFPLKPNPWENRVSWLDDCDHLWFVAPFDNNDTCQLWVFDQNNLLYYFVDEWYDRKYNQLGIPDPTTKPHPKSHGSMGWVVNNEFYMYSGFGTSQTVMWKYHPDEVIADFSYTVSIDTCYKVEFTNNSTTGCNFLKSHHWDFDDLGATSDSVHAVHYFSGPGTFDVELIVGNCTWDYDTVVYQINIPVSCFAGEEELNLESISLQPNPASQIVSIELNNTEQCEVRIYTTAGRLVYKNLLTNKSTNNIDVSMFEAGLYIVELSTEGYSNTRKLVVQ